MLDDRDEFYKFPPPTRHEKIQTWFALRPWISFTYLWAMLSLFAFTFGLGIFIIVRDILKMFK